MENILKDDEIMTNCEHLIENALCVIGAGYSYECFSNKKYNTEMAKIENISLEQIWQMAIYVYYTYTPSCKENIIYDLENKLGFSLKDY